MEFRIGVIIQIYHIFWKRYIMSACAYEETQTLAHSSIPLLRGARGVFLFIVFKPCIRWIIMRFFNPLTQGLTLSLAKFQDRENDDYPTELPDSFPER